MTIDSARPDDLHWSGPVPGTIRRGMLGVYLLLLLALIVGSTIRRVGDGGEYLSMAEHLARFQLPTIPVEGSPPDPSAPRHFWFYSALATPFLPLTHRMGFDPLAAFMLPNLLVLGAAFWLAAAELSWSALLLVFVSPIIWWIDKAHTEVFTFALLTIAVIALGSRDVPPRDRDDPIGAAGEGSRRRAAPHPGWAVVCLGAAGTQNPSIAVLVPLAILVLVLSGRVSLRDQRFIDLCLVGLALAVLHPAYYYMRATRLTLLSEGAHRHIPNLDEITAVIRDSNIGLVVNAPAFALATVLAIAVLLRSPRRLFAADTAFSLCAAAVFLASFAQTTNFNSGGTPGMTRYALWFIPLAIPFLRSFDRVSVSAVLRRSMALLAAISSVWSLMSFHPKWPEEYGKPTAFATWLWTKHPALDRPLPEVFIERTHGADAPWWVPAAMPKCEKLLLTGRGTGVPMWPFPCPTAPVTPRCMEPGVMCYADLQGSSYRFTEVPAPSSLFYRFQPDAVWTAAEMRTVGAMIQGMRMCPVEMAEEAHTMDAYYYYCANDRILVYIRNPREGAGISMRLPTRMTGSFIDPATGQQVESVAYDGQPGELWDLAVPAPLASVVLTLTRTK